MIMIVTQPSTLPLPEDAEIQPKAASLGGHDVVHHSSAVSPPKQVKAPKSNLLGRRQAANHPLSDPQEGLDGCSPEKWWCSNAIQIRCSEAEVEPKLVHHDGKLQSKQNRNYGIESEPKGKRHFWVICCVAEAKNKTVWKFKNVFSDVQYCIMFY